MKRLNLAFASIVFSIPLSAEEPIPPKRVEVFISPECKSMYYGVFDEVEASKLPSYVLWDPSEARSLVYRDARTSTVFYVESDGRHVAAMDSGGKLLWVRNPFEEGHECSYRSPRPVIAKLEAFEVSKALLDNYRGKPFDITHKFLKITFNSSAFGLLDEKTGDYYPMGQN